MVEGGKLFVDYEATRLTILKGDGEPSSFSPRFPRRPRHGRHANSRALAGVRGKKLSPWQRLAPLRRHGLEGWLPPAERNLRNSNYPDNGSLISVVSKFLCR